MLPSERHPTEPILEDASGQFGKADARISESLKSRTSHGIRVFAVVVYTFDLCLIKVKELAARENNFYYILNEKLRKRSGDFLHVAHGYLYYLMTALDRLLPMTGVVFRGIDKEKAAAAMEKFKAGMRFHFSAFSSTSPNYSVAAAFASGGGLILRTKLLDENSMSKDIHELSAFGSTEAEVILLPNFKCFVTGTQENGIDIIDLMEELPAETAIDF